MLVVISFLRVAGRAYTMSHPGCSCEPDEASFLMARMQSSFFFAFQSLTAAKTEWDSIAQNKLTRIIFGSLAQVKGPLRFFSPPYFSHRRPILCHLSSALANRNYGGRNYGGRVMVAELWWHVKLGGQATHFHKNIPLTFLDHVRTMLGPCFLPNARYT